MSAGSPFFSVIIPAYNRANVLGRAIRSVLDQSFQDFEMVIMDDGSADDPKTAAESFRDPRIRFFRQDNEGGGAARNAAIYAATGRYIAPLDSDDVFLPHHLQTMKDMLEHSTGTVGYARILVDRGEGRTFLKPPRAIRAGEDMGEYLLCDRGFVPTITIVVDRLLAAKVRYHVNLRAAEDTDFAIRLSLAGAKFQMAPRPGAVWTDMHDPNRTSAGVSKAGRYEAWLRQMKPLLTRRAWYGARGWAYAKMMARDGHKLAALRFYLGALLRLCYNPRLAGIIFLQIFLDAHTYRGIADRAISWLHMGLREPAQKPAKPLSEQA